MPSRALEYVASRPWPPWSTIRVSWPLGEFARCLLACAVLCSFHRGTGNARFASQALDRLSLFGSLLHTAVPSKPLRVAPTPPSAWRSTAFGSRRDARRAGAYAPSAAAATNPAVTSTTKGRLNDGTPTAAVTALLASRQSTR